MKQEPPTRDEVEDYIYDSEGETDSEGNDTFYRRLAKAYSAQEEDMEKVSPYVVGLVMEIADLKAQNHALQDALVNQRRSLGREADDLRESLVKVQVAAKEEINRLQAENHELKAKLEGTFRFEAPKSGELLPYHIDEEGTLP